MWVDNIAAILNKRELKIINRDRLQYTITVNSIIIDLALLYTEIIK